MEHPVTPVEQLEELRPLLRLIVNERIGSQEWLRDDADQEAMIAAWERLEQGYSPGIAVFKARQAVIDVVRGRRATGSKQAHGGQTDSHTRSSSIFRQTEEGEEFVFEPADHSAEDALEAAEARMLLSGAMDPLSQRQREIVEAVFWEGLSQEEIAARYGISRQAVSKALNRAYATMRSVIA